MTKRHRRHSTARKPAHRLAVILGRDRDQEKRAGIDDLCATQEFADTRSR